MPLPPHHLLLQQNPEWFTFLVPACPGCPGKKGRQTDVAVVVPGFIYFQLLFMIMMQCMCTSVKN